MHKYQDFVVEDIIKINLLLIGRKYSVVYDTVLRRRDTNILVIDFFLRFFEIFLKKVHLVHSLDLLKSRTVKAD